MGGDIPFEGHPIHYLLICILHIKLIVFAIKWGGGKGLKISVRYLLQDDRFDEGIVRNPRSTKLLEESI